MGRMLSSQISWLLTIFFFLLRHHQVVLASNESASVSVYKPEPDSVPSPIPESSSTMFTLFASGLECDFSRLAATLRSRVLPQAALPVRTFIKTQKFPVASGLNGLILTECDKVALHFSGPFTEHIDPSFIHEFLQMILNKIEASSSNRVTLMNPICQDALALVAPHFTTEQVERLLRKFPEAIEANVDFLESLHDFRAFDQAFVAKSKRMFDLFNPFVSSRAVETMPTESLSQLLRGRFYDLGDEEVARLIDLRGVENFPKLDQLAIELLTRIHLKPPTTVFFAMKPMVLEIKRRAKKGSRAAIVFEEHEKALILMAIAFNEKIISDAVHKLVLKWIEMHKNERIEFFHAQFIDSGIIESIKRRKEEIFANDIETLMKELGPQLQDRSEFIQILQSNFADVEFIVDFCQFPLDSDILKSLKHEENAMVSEDGLAHNVPEQGGPGQTSATAFPEIPLMPTTEEVKYARFDDWPLAWLKIVPALKAHGVFSVAESSIKDSDNLHAKLASFTDKIGYSGNFAHFTAAAMELSEDELIQMVVLNPLGKINPTLISKLQAKYLPSSSSGDSRFQRILQTSMQASNSRLHHHPKTLLKEIYSLQKELVDLRLKLNTLSSGENERQLQHFQSFYSLSSRMRALFRTVDPDDLITADFLEHISKSGSLMSTIHSIPDMFTSDQIDTLLSDENGREFVQKHSKLFTEQHSYWSFDDLSFIHRAFTSLTWGLHSLPMQVITAAIRSYSGLITVPAQLIWNIHPSCWTDSAFARDAWELITLPGLLHTSSLTQLLSDPKDQMMFVHATSVTRHLKSTMELYSKKEDGPFLRREHEVREITRKMTGVLPIKMDLHSELIIIICKWLIMQEIHAHGAYHLLRHVADSESAALKQFYAGITNAEGSGRDDLCEWLKEHQSENEDFKGLMPLVRNLPLSPLRLLFARIPSVVSFKQFHHLKDMSAQGIVASASTFTDQILTNGQFLRSLLKKYWGPRNAQSLFVWETRLEFVQLLSATQYTLRAPLRHSWIRSLFLIDGNNANKTGLIIPMHDVALFSAVLLDIGIDPSLSLNSDSRAEFINVGRFEKPKIDVNSEEYLTKKKEVAARVAAAKAVMSSQSVSKEND